MSSEKANANSNYNDANHEAAAEEEEEATARLLLSKHAVCVCDDDNDLEMALACKHAYIPEVSSPSMAQAIRDNADRFTETFVSGGEETTITGPQASEKALSLVLARLK